MFVFYLLLFAVLIAWYQASWSKLTISSGYSSVVLGCCLTSFGIIWAAPADKMYGFIVIATGLIITVLGATRIITAKR